MTEPLPYPPTLDPSVLLDVLSLRQNAKLRRELGTLLGPLADREWPSSKETEVGGWAVALLDLLARPDGAVSFRMAADQHNRGPLDANHKLNLPRAARRFAVREGRKSCARPETAATIKALLDAGATPQAALLAWATALCDPGKRATIGAVVRESTELCAAFGLTAGPMVVDMSGEDASAEDVPGVDASSRDAPAMGSPGGTESLEQLRAAAAAMAAAERPGIAALEALAELATNLAAALRHAEAQNARARDALSQRLAASPLALGNVQLPPGIPLANIEAALDAAEQAQRVAEAAAAAFREASSTPGRISTFDLIEEKLRAARIANEAADASRSALMQRLPDPSDPESVPEPSQSAITPGPEPAFQDVNQVAEEPVAEQALAVEAPKGAPQPLAPPPLQEAPAGSLAVPPERVATGKTACPPAAPTDPEPEPEQARAPTPDSHPDIAPSCDAGQRAVLRAMAEKRLGLIKALLVAGAVPSRASLLGASVQLAATAMVANDATDPGDVSSIVEAFRNSWTTYAGGDLATTAWLLALPAAGLMIVLAPGGNPADLVDTLLRAPPERMPHTLALARALSENAAQLSVLSQATDALQSAVGEDVRRQQMIAQGDALRTWLERNREPHLNNYAPAKILWSRMIQPDEALGGMLVDACADAADRAAAIAEELARFNGQKEMERLDVALRGARLVQKTPIAHGARRDLGNLLEEAERLLHEWVRVARRAATQEQRGMAHALRELLLPLIRSAADEIGALSGEPAAPTANAILARFIDLLAHGIWPGGRGNSDQLLARDVLQVPGIVLDSTWRMSVPLGPDMLVRLVEAVDAPIPVEAAIRRRLEASDLAEAVLALSLVEDDDARAELDRATRDAAGARHQAMVKGLAEARTDIEAAEGTGRLDYGLAQRFLKDIDDLETLLRLAAPEDISSIESDFATLRGAIRNEMENATAQQRARILQRMSSLDLTVQAAIRSEVTRLIDQGWLPNAEDLIDRAESGEHIDTGVEYTDSVHGFAEFFPAPSERIARALRTHRPGITGFAEQAGPLPDELAMPLELREAGQRLARAWVACAVGRNPSTAFAALFAQLGFSEARMDGIAPLASGATRLTLRVQPLRDRDTTLLPDFGSVADGSYPVIALINQPELRQVRVALQQLGGTARASFVLYFGILTNPDRRELARMAAVGQLGSAIVIDHVLLAHLAMSEGDRLRTLFACTLPFSGLAPWSAIGTPAPEIFFGRHDERQGIEARSGRISHLVYGGRQLGKTALLRQIEGAAAGDARRIVRYVDIKSFGTNHPTAEIWSALAEALRTAVPMAADRGGDAGMRFVRDVVSWLEGNADRSILLLLDEADKFFKEDQANNYHVTEQLRGLAERTGRRFKPVFAGLENVQRMARDPNNPIAQLGLPLLIGPLLRREERRAAETLVRWPFEALGFTLAGSVVNRILVFANYYPSLIQLVCESLLRELRARQSGAPPWPVEMADVESLLARPDMRRAAFDKFRITLELDPRYDLLALAVAARNQEEALTLSSGIAAFRLRDDAAAFWPAGFASFDEEAFDALLDQMVGLGVLRATGGRRYALRSANLIHLIGSPKAIEDQLLAFLDRPAPNEPDPLEHRRYIDDAPSLLTTRQEADLLGLNIGDGVVICLGLGLGGTPAGDGSRIDRAVRQAMLALPLPRRPAIPVLRVSDAAGFQRELTALAARGGEQALLVIVTPKHGWTPEWVHIAVATSQARPAGRTTLRIVFIADASRGWLWTEASPDREALLAAGGAERRLVTEIVPGLWNRPGVDVWMTLYDPSRTLPDWLVSDRATLLHATGGWDWALRRLMAMGRPGPARTDAAGLAAILLDRAGSDAAIRELAELPGLAALFAAVEEAQSLRNEGELVTPDLLADLVGQPLSGLAWAQAAELVVPGAQGLELNPLLRAVLPLFGTITR